MSCLGVTERQTWGARQRGDRLLCEPTLPSDAEQENGAHAHTMCTPTKSGHAFEMSEMPTACSRSARVRQRGRAPTGCPAAVRNRASTRP